ncbi:sarcosine oxidase subunit gamma [Thioclava sp. GXIMD2076]|uniref:sarcosine oxidase subunit gamma n=1 Tax=Thioclava sp. GXIMD2076 TaxID=3131931 RepID=UPI0030CD3BCB
MTKPVTDLIALTALGETAPKVETFGSMTLTERPDIALASLAMRRGQSLSELAGMVLPAPGALAQGAGLTAFWAGQGQWMIEGPSRAHEDFAAWVKTQAEGASVTEQTDGWVAFDVTGEDVEALLERLVNLPDAAKATGMATRTGLHHMSVFLLRLAPDHCRIWGMRSYAGSLWHTLNEAAARLG